MQTSTEHLNHDETIEHLNLDETIDSVDNVVAEHFESELFNAPPPDPANLICTLCEDYLSLRRITLPCAHVFCHLCIENHFEEQSQRRGQSRRQCPECALTRPEQFLERDYVLPRSTNRPQVVGMRTRHMNQRRTQYNPSAQSFSLAHARDDIARYPRLTERQRTRLHQSTFALPLNVLNETCVPAHHLGTLYNENTRCQYCNAWKFPGETITCCGPQGRWRDHCATPDLNPDHDSTLTRLLLNQTRAGSVFRHNMRTINNALSFALYNMEIVNPRLRFSPALRVQGTIYIGMGGLNPPPINAPDVPQRFRSAPGFSEIYFWDGDRTGLRMNILRGGAANNRDTNDFETMTLRQALESLDGLIRRRNALYQQFFTIREHLNTLPESDVHEATLHFYDGQFHRRYVALEGVNEPVHHGQINAPRENVALLHDTNMGRSGIVSTMFPRFAHRTAQPDDETANEQTDEQRDECLQRNAALHVRLNVLHRDAPANEHPVHERNRRVSILNDLWLPLHFPLIFPSGLPLWQRRRNGPSLQQWLRFICLPRDDDRQHPVHDYLFLMGKLMQQFIIAAFLAWEENSMNFYRNHKSRLRRFNKYVKHLRTLRRTKLVCNAS